MAWDHERTSSRALLKKGAHAKTADLIFTKSDAYDLVRRIGRLYPLLVSDEAAGEDLATEYERQFDGYPLVDVDRAVTVAIGKHTGAGAPGPGKIKAELRSNNAGHTGTQYATKVACDYSHLPERITNSDWGKRFMAQGCHPDYLRWAERDRRIHQETVIALERMTPERARQLGLDKSSLQEAARIMGGKSRRELNAAECEALIGSDVHEIEGGE